MHCELDLVIYNTPLSFFNLFNECSSNSIIFQIVINLKSREIEKSNSIEKYEVFSLEIDKHIEKLKNDSRC